MIMETILKPFEMPWLGNPKFSVCGVHNAIMIGAIQPSAENSNYESHTSI